MISLTVSFDKVYEKERAFKAEKFFMKIDEIENRGVL